MTVLSLGQAARLTGLGKSTIARSIKRGTLSATRLETGAYEIDASELARVYPVVTSAVARADGTPRDADGLVEELRRVISDLRSDRDDLRADRDHWRSAFENQQRLLPAPSARRRWRWWPS